MLDSRKGKNTGWSSLSLSKVAHRTLKAEKGGIDICSPEISPSNNNQQRMRD